MEVNTIPCDLLIRNCSVVLPDFSVIENGAIAVSGNRIKEIGGSESLGKKYTAMQELDGRCKLAMPGMYDCHAHSVQQFLKGGVVDEPPIVWRRILVPYESTLTDEDRYWAAMTYCMQALRAGITMFADAGTIDMMGTVRAVEETGIRAAIARVGRLYDPELPENMCDKDEETCLKRQEEFYLKANGKANGRIQAWFSASSPMVVTEKLLHMVGEAAKAYNTGVHVHLAEHPAEVQYCLCNFKKRPPALLADCGALGPNLIAAHCIQLSDYDIRLIAECGAHIIHCPTANLTTQGIPKLLAERAAGVSVALGNDGACVAKQDMFNQMQILKYVTQAVYGTPVFEPVVLPLNEMFDMATKNGARALGVGDELGTLEVGKKADIVLLDISSPVYQPTLDIMKTVLMVGAAQDVKDVIVDGKVLIKDGSFTMLDEEMIRRKAAEQFHKIMCRS